MNIRTLAKAQDSEPATLPLECVPATETDMGATEIGRERSLVPVTANETGDDEPDVWGIPRQYQIEIKSCADGSVLIEQEGPYSSADDDGAIIEVAGNNAVAIARRILWAAGFRGVLIAVTGDKGHCDLEDGATPEQFRRGRE